MRHLDLAEIARADLKSIRRYSQRTWGPDRTARYMAGLRDTRHCVFFEADPSRILVVRVLHDRMDYRRHLETDQAADQDG